MLGAWIRRRRRHGLRLPSRNLFLAKELRKVCPLQPQRFGRPGLVPVVFLQRVLEHPTTECLHHRVITGCVAWPVLIPFGLTGSVATDTRRKTGAVCIRET